jgi:hypothetical protein
MKSLRIGHVDLDTSHPANWIPIERELGHEVVAVYDGGTVWPEGYAQEFARQHGVPTTCRVLEEMVPLVDLAIIHSANWDLHLPRAKPFLEAGKAVLIDKPIAGNLRDLQELRTLAESGALLSGGSSLRFATEAQSLLAELREKGETPIFAFAGCGVDEFNYGIHAYALACALMGPGLSSVRFLGEHYQKQVELVWADGRRAILNIGAPSGGRWLPFYATVVTEANVYHVVPQPGALYRALLSTLLPYFAGEAPAPVPFAALIEPELAALAARDSWRHCGTRTYLGDLRLDDPGYDGAAFAQEYRRQRLSAGKH